MNEPLKVRTDRQVRVVWVRAQRWTLASRLRAPYILLIFALWTLGFMSTKARPLGGNEALWAGLFLLTYSPWVPAFLAYWTRLQSTETSWWKRAGTLVVTNIGLCLLYYPAIFGGVPKLLHYVSHAEGTLVTTITVKSDWVSRYHFCSPRIDLAAISAPFYGDVCVSRKFFEAVKVGDRVRLRGNMSRYAIEPTEIVLIR